MRLVSYLALSSLALGGCQQDAPARPSTAVASVKVPATTVPASVPPPAVASTGVVAPASATGAPRRSLADVRRATDRACQPLVEGTNNIELKQQQLESSQCIERAMIRDLDRVLVPLKAAAPARFRTLMDQQAAYNHFASALAFLAEEAMWVDFEAGTRSSGTLRGTAAVGCKASAALERTVYANALASGDAAAVAAALAGEVRAAEKRGVTTRRALAAIEAGAAKRALLPAAPSDPGIEPMDAEAWKALFQNAQSASELAATLARSTCDDVAGLAGLLGGAKACRDSVANYHLAACDLEPLLGDGR